MIFINNFFTLLEYWVNKSLSRIDTESVECIYKKMEIEEKPPVCECSLCYKVDQISSFFVFPLEIKEKTE
jgi:hypothetical protein